MMNIVCTRDDRFNGPSSFSILYFSVVMVRKELVMVSSGKKTLWPSRRRYILWRRLRLYTTTSRGHFFLCERHFFVGALFFSLLICHESTCRKIMVLICGAFLCLRLSLSLRPYNRACPHGHGAHHSFACVHRRT